MAGFDLTVTPSVLENVSNNVDSATNEYITLYTRIYSEINSLKGSWLGEASEAFIKQIEGFENDFKSMEKLLKKYVEFLSVAGNNYQQTENQNIENAKNEIKSGL